MVLTLVLLGFLILFFYIWRKYKKEFFDIKKPNSGIANDFKQINKLIEQLNNDFNKINKNGKL